MFKIYSLVLLSFLYLQNINAADQREEFPEEASMRHKLIRQQEEIEHLQQMFKKLFQEQPEKSLKYSTKLSSFALKHENVDEDENTSNLPSFSKLRGVDEQKVNEFEHYFEQVKYKLQREGEGAIEKRRHEIEKMEAEKKDKDQKIEKKLLEQKASYQQMGIAFRLAVKDGREDLLESEKFRFMFHFPLTFSPIDDETRVRLMLSREDQECLTASGENRDLIYNLMSSINVEIQVLHDMIKKGYEIKKQQSQRD